MKLLIDARSLGNHPSGVGMYLYDFLRELIEQPEFEITVLSDIAVSDEMHQLAEAGVPIVTYGTPVSQSVQVFRYFRFVQDSLDYFHPDIFWEPNNLIPVRLRRFSGKLLVTIHDVFPLTQPETHGLIYPHYFRYGLRRTVRQADYLTYNSNETRQEVARFFPGTTKIPGLVSYIIVRKPVFADTILSPELLFDGIPINGEDFFLYIGNLEKRKGTDLLVKAYVRYRKAGGQKKLYLGGSIREPEIQKLYEEVHAKIPELLAIGYVTEEQKSVLFRYCAGFLFPSRAEGFGIPIIEAMHYNKPILASNLSIFQEIVGETISYYDCSGSEDEQIQNLSDGMLTLQHADLDAYAEIRNRYLPETLSARFRAFLLQAGQDTPRT